MSLQWQLSREVPPDTAEVGQEVLDADDVYRQIGERFDALFPAESVFAGMYESGGRGAESPLLMALVVVFQMLEKVPDRTAAAWVAKRLDWKYALHLPMKFRAFHFTALYAFRQRLQAHDQVRQLFDLLLAQLKETGLLQDRGKMRTDSTHVLAVVERLSQLELVTESVRLALRALEALAPDWVRHTVTAEFGAPYATRQSEYKLSESEVAQRLAQAGQDGFWLVAQVEQHEPVWARTVSEVAVLRQVLSQQFPQGSSQPPAAKRPSGQAVIESPHEPEARRGYKRGQAWLGYKVQVTETCDDERPHLIVDLTPTSALANDSPELEPLHDRLAAQALLPAEQWVDQGYMSGQNLVDSAEQGVTLIGTPLDDTQGPSGFQQADFQIDEAAQHALCPAGQVSVVWTVRPVATAKPSATTAEPPAAIQVRFAAATCRACPHWGVCTQSAQGRSLTLHPYRAALTAQRALAKTEAYRLKQHRRAGVEATISELVRGYGLRRARYRGQAKLALQMAFTAVAINLKRLVRWWTRLQPDPVAVAAS